MRAIVYDKKTKTLEFQEVPLPRLKNNEVLIKVKALSLNAADYRSLEMGIIRKEDEVSPTFKTIK